jgi:hypothetical protein
MHNHRRLIFIGLISLALAACGTPQTPDVPVVPTSAQPLVAATAVRVTSPAQTATARPSTTTPTREATALPTALPEQPTLTAPIGDGGMNSDFPQLIFPTTNGLMAVAADGTQLRLLSEAQPVVMHNLKDGIAPFSGLLAFISGDNPMTPDSEGSGPLSLNLLFSYGGGVTSVTPLFSAELEQAIRSATATGDRNDAIEAAIAVIDNSDMLKWSPDGRYLAFIAAIDGPSSDVYSYDRESGQINRLTDGLNQAARLFWSPDSQWIVHEEVASFGTGAGWSVIAVWAAAPDGSTTRKLYNAGDSGDEVFVDWVMPDTFLVYSWTPMGWQNVRLVNLATGEAQRVGPDFPVQTLAYDPETQTYLYYGDDFVMQQRGLSGGLYLDAPDAISKPPHLITSSNWYTTRWLPHMQLFFAAGKDGVISVTRTGTATRYDIERAIPIESPDGNWLLAWRNADVINSTGLRLYTPDGKLARTITQDTVLVATWSPDSTGAFYVSAGALRYVSIPDGEPQVVAEKLISAEPASYVWVEP